MSQLQSLWSAFDTRRRAIVIVASLAVFAAVLGLSRYASQPGMSLLYAGLETSQAGEVIRSLDQQNVQYQVRGGSIYVEESMRDQLRMTLASEGLPSNTGAGYELLDTLSGFGTTSQMFDAAYWRAKEGELARTIVSSPQIRNARVHIATPSLTAFRRDQKTSASVTVTPTSGTLPPQTAQGLSFLVASAVAGLAPADVAIIDAATGEVVTADSGSDSSAAGGEKAAEFKARLERLLEARVGRGNAIVEVSVDTETQSESIFERRIDPESRVAISTDTEEVSNTSSDGGGAAVTVASNLPTGDAGGEGNSSQSSNSELRERMNFEISETTREITRRPGAIRRITAAILVNGVADENGVWQARSEEELADFHDLVASAIGYDEARGDVITVKSLEFGEGEVLGTEASGGLFDSVALEPMRLIQLAVLSTVALILGLFVIRPILTGRNREALIDDSEAGALATLEGAVSLNEVTDADLAQGNLSTGNADAAIDLTADTALPAPGGDAASADGMPALESDPIGHLKSLIEERQPDTIEILRNWMEEDTAKEQA